MERVWGIGYLKVGYTDTASFHMFLSGHDQSIGKHKMAVAHRRNVSCLAMVKPGAGGRVRTAADSRHH
jgi:hypothetical protein